MVCFDHCVYNTIGHSIECPTVCYLHEGWYVLAGVCLSASLLARGYWRQRADERLGDLTPRWIQEPLVVRDRDGRPQEDPLAVHCFCVCSGSALLGDLLEVSRSRERDLPSVLSIYPRIFLCVFIMYRRIVRILCLLYSAICWCVLVALV